MRASPGFDDLESRAQGKAAPGRTVGKQESQQKETKK